MKNIGVVTSESSTEELRISLKDNFESISTKASPFGRAIRMNEVNAVVILSGLKHLSTKSFWKGIWSNFFQSKGNFCVSGANSLYQSLKRIGASFSIF